MPGGKYVSDQSTSGAKRHLESDMIGHRLGKDGPLPPTRKRQRTLPDTFDERSAIDQQTANDLIESFNPRVFLEAVVDWITESNHPLREVENPAFCKMIRIANVDAENALWKSHNTVRSKVLDDYNAYIPSVKEKVANSVSLLHISFDGWTTKNKKKAITGIYVHHLDNCGKVVDYILGLLEQLGRHSADNYATVVEDTLTQFGISKEKIGYFVTDNVNTNDACMRDLADSLGFNAEYRRVRCSGHVINLVSQNILFGRDKEAYENAPENILVSLLIYY